VLDGPINAEAFKPYVEKALVPTLQRGDLVIMDNLSSHKGKAVRGCIRSAGATLFFLAQILTRPQLIEKVFAKLKHLLRKAAAPRSKPLSPPYASSWEPTPQRNAPTTSPTSDTSKPKFIPIQAIGITECDFRS
jgi:transposase